ncbi:hypothetical protein [Apilactobacillus quenuiae]|uniref:hypothetical protein n=1 Tax=Apilactobacillus quenuiae TaxID=2008377 RepID=UPI000D01451A|nr:hypothetical protein [Apilactobacillus quenuiae]
MVEKAKIANAKAAYYKGKDELLKIYDAKNDWEPLSFTNGKGTVLYNEYQNRMIGVVNTDGKNNRGAVYIMPKKDHLFFLETHKSEKSTQLASGFRAKSQKNGDLKVYGHRKNVKFGTAIPIDIKCKLKKIN